MPETLAAGDARESWLARVADDFLAEVRCGRRPSVEEVNGRNPDLADELRKVLPALALLGASGEDHSGLGASPARSATSGSSGRPAGAEWA